MTKQDQYLKPSKKTNSDLIKKRKRKRKKRPSQATQVSSSSIQRVVKDGKIVSRKKKQRSSKSSTTTLKKSHSIKHQQHKNDCNKKLTKRLSVAAIIIGTIGLSTTTTALNQHKTRQETAHIKHQMTSNEYKPGSIKFKEKTSQKGEEKDSQITQITTSSSQQITRTSENMEEVMQSQGSDSPIDYSSDQESDPSQINELQTTQVMYQEDTVNQSQPNMTLNILGNIINYQNGGQQLGQSIIDANSDTTASTWGGTTVFSGDDGMNTHFIGHNPGVFSIIFNLSIGNEITVTDANGVSQTYIVNLMTQVTDDGRDIRTGTALYEDITGTGGGERITLQTCINDSVNLIIFASA